MDDAYGVYVQNKFYKVVLYFILIYKLWSSLSQFGTNCFIVFVSFSILIHIGYSVILRRKSYQSMVRWLFIKKVTPQYGPITEKRALHIEKTCTIVEYWKPLKPLLMRSFSSLSKYWRKRVLSFQNTRFRSLKIILSF